MSIAFPHNYPYNAPKIKFITPIYHPNVNGNKTIFPSEECGSICLECLNFWKPETCMKVVFTNIFALFYFENKSYSFNLDMLGEINKTPDLYKKKQKFFTKKYADPSKGYKEYIEWDFTLDETFN